MRTLWDSIGEPNDSEILNLVKVGIGLEIQG